MIIAFRLSKLGFGGAEQVFISVAGYLAKTHNIEIHFVVDRLGVGELETIAIRKGFKIYGLDCSRTIHSIFPLSAYLEANNPDILISAYTDTNMAALISVKLAKNRCVTIVSEHASLDEHWQNSSLKRRILLNGYVSIGYKLADHILTVSQGIAAQIMHRINATGKLSCIYNPVRFNAQLPVSAANSVVRHGEKTILAVGRITPQKDYLNLLSAFKIVQKKMNVRLVIVGGIQDFDEKKILDNYIEANHLNSKVLFAGYTEHVELYYTAADLFVLSSAWEGFGNVLVEALAFGLPIVSTNCKHGPAEILCNGKYGTLVPVGDPRALATAIFQTFDAPEHQKFDLYKRSGDFTEEVIGAQYWDLIHQLCSST